MLNKTIRICGVEDSGTQIKIIDENKFKYSFFKEKKAGGNTVAWEQFQKLKVGDTTGIGFNDNPNPKNPALPFHNIVNFTPPNYAQQAQVAQQSAQSPTLAPNTPPSGKNSVTEPTYTPVEPYKQRNFKQEGYEKCLWSYWVASGARKSTEVLSPYEMDLVWAVFNQIEKDSEKRFAPKTGWQKAVDIFGGEEVPLPTDVPPDGEV
jgi:hypothetical protein